MITLDQVLLLQEKVESAVSKMEQLKAENDALRSKCAELTNALSAKTEQFSTFEADQSKIEHGILKALERLNAVENAVVQAAANEVSQQHSTPTGTENISEESPTEVTEEITETVEVPAEALVQEDISEPVVTASEEPAPESEISQISETTESNAQESETQQGQFDIF